MDITRRRCARARAGLLGAAVLSLLPACTAGDAADPTGAGGAPEASSAATEPVPTLGPVSTGERLRVPDLPEGPPPRVDYLDGNDVVRPTGEFVTLPLPPPPGDPRVPDRLGSEFFWSFAPLSRGWVASTFVEGGPFLQRHGEDGERLGDMVFALGWILDWSQRDGRVLTHHRVIQPDGSSIGLGASPVGFLGSQVVATRGGRFKTHLGRPGDWQRIPGRWYVHATAAAGRRVIASTPSSTGVFELPSTDLVLEVADGPAPFSPGGDDSGPVVLHDLSPRGRYLVGSRLHPRPATLFVADADDGRILATAPGLGGRYDMQFAWENERSLLTVHDRRHIVRVRVDGRVERAAGPTALPYGYLLPGAEPTS